MARRVGPDPSFVIGFPTEGGGNFTSHHDNFTADTHNVEIDWHGGRNLTFENDTFVKGENPSSDYTTLFVMAGRFQSPIYISWIAFF
jgi:hypothetical protein